MYLNHKRNNIALSLWRGMTYRRLQKLRQIVSADAALFALKKKQWLQLGFSEDLFSARVLPTDSSVIKVMQWAEESGADLIAFDDEGYPPLLREIASPPLLLYALGHRDVLLKKQIAIVGSRRASPRALELAAELAEGLVAADIVVTSGLALGVDTAAHQGALQGEGETVAVMANGLGSVYPFSNAPLAARIAETGVLLSEQPPWVGPKAGLFPRRNRIVSGLSLGVLVVQGHLKSGSLITARLALEQNREVMAVPGEAGSAQAGGCHWLLKQGAALVESVADIFQCLGWESTTAPMAKKTEKKPALSPIEEALLHCIDTTDTALDKIIERYTGDSSDILSLLSQLELAGLLQRTISGYCRC